MARLVGGAPARPRRVLPGAQQLELLRRLNLAGSSARPTGSNGPGLDSPTACSPPPLPVAGSRTWRSSGWATSPYGPRPVDPRDAAGRRAGPGRHQRARRGRRRRSACRLRRVACGGSGTAGTGSPATRSRPPPCATTSRAVVARRVGRRPRRWSSAARSTRCSPTCGPAAASSAAPAAGWSGCASGSSATTCPPRIDLPAVAARHAQPADRPRPLEAAAASCAYVACHRPSRPGADAAELARRIATVVGLLVPPDERADADDAHRCCRGCPRRTAPPVGVPDEHREWVRAAAERMARRLSRAGYPVVGDPAVLVPTEAPAGPSVAPTELVLELAVRMLVDDTMEGAG